MSITYTSLRALLGMALVALLSNNVLADEPNAAKSDTGHAWSKAHDDCHGDHFAKHMSKLHDALKLSAKQEPAWTDFIKGCQMPALKHAAMMIPHPPCGQASDKP